MHISVKNGTKFHDALSVGQGVFLYGGKNMEQNGMPVGFGMALNQNTEAMIHYAAMTQEQRNAIREKASSIQTKEEMYHLVAQIANGTL